MNQNPNPLAPALTTRQDLNGIANAKVLRRLAPVERVAEHDPDDGPAAGQQQAATAVGASPARDGTHGAGGGGKWASWRTRVIEVVKTFGRFVGPGFMVRLSSPRMQESCLMSC